MLFFCFLLFCIIVNMWIGAYVAILLGYGPSSMTEAVHMLVDVRRIQPWVDTATKRLPLDRIVDIIVSMVERLRSIPFPFYIPFGRKSQVVEEVANVEPLPSQSAAVPQPPSIEEQLAEAAMVSVDSLFDDNAEEIGMVSPVMELFDDDLTAALMEAGTEAWLMGEKTVETSILKLNHVLMKSGRLAANLDRDLRAAAGVATPPFIDHCVRLLQDDCNEYLLSEAATTEQLRNSVNEYGELKDLFEEIEMSNMEQSAQVETTLSNLAMITTQPPEQARTNLIRELGKLRAARHRLRDQEDQAFLTVLRYQQKLDTINQKLFYDELIGIRGRIGLEVAIDFWWKQGRQQSRQLTFALVDLVNFGELNDNHGTHVGDAILKYLGRSYEKLFDSQDIVAIFSGNCFLIVTIHAGVRKTLSEIEKLRQSLDRTIFSYNGGTNEVRVQLTAAILEAKPTQQPTQVYNLLTKLLKMAKKDGKNCTFFMDQSRLEPAPERVDSPGFGADYTTIDLDEYLDRG